MAHLAGSMTFNELISKNGSISRSYVKLQEGHSRYFSEYIDPWFSCVDPHGQHAKMPKKSRQGRQRRVFSGAHAFDGPSSKHPAGLPSPWEFAPGLSAEMGMCLGRFHMDHPNMNNGE